MPLLASDTLAKRMKSVALEREKIRQRERERLARGEKVVLRQSPKQYMQRRSSNFNLNKWVGQEEARAEADPGRLSRRGALCRLSVLPHGHAGRSRCWSRHDLRVRHSRDRPAGDRQGRHLHVRRLSRHANAVAVPEEPDPEAAIVDPPRLPGRARPAADLRGIRHVDRGRVQARRATKSAANRSRSPKN